MSVLIEWVMQSSNLTTLHFVRSPYCIVWIRSRSFGKTPLPAIAQLDTLSLIAAPRNLPRWAPTFAETETDCEISSYCTKCINLATDREPRVELSHISLIRRMGQWKEKQNASASEDRRSRRRYVPNTHTHTHTDAELQLINELGALGFKIQRTTYRIPPRTDKTFHCFLKIQSTPTKTARNGLLQVRVRVWVRVWVWVWVWVWVRVWMFWLVCGRRNKPKVCHAFFMICVSPTRFLRNTISEIFH